MKGGFSGHVDGGLPKMLANSAADYFGMGFVGLRADDDELFASPAGYYIGVAHATTKNLGEPQQRLVSYLVSPTVIHVLEVVDIGDEDESGVTGAAEALGFELHEGREEAAVLESS